MFLSKNLPREQLKLSRKMVRGIEFQLPHQIVTHCLNSHFSKFRPIFRYRNIDGLRRGDKTVGNSC